jgi:hypothetical protein
MYVPGLWEETYITDQMDNHSAGAFLFHSVRGGKPTILPRSPGDVVSQLIGTLRSGQRAHARVGDHDGYSFPSGPTF